MPGHSHLNLILNTLGISGYKKGGGICGVVPKVNCLIIWACPKRIYFGNDSIIVTFLGGGGQGPHTWSGAFCGHWTEPLYDSTHSSDSLGDLLVGIMTLMGGGR